MSMTKHLTKPIRAIHFMVLAFLLTICTMLVPNGQAIELLALMYYVKFMGYRSIDYKFMRSN